MDFANVPDKLVFGLDIGTRSIVGTVGYKQNESDFIVVAQAVKFHETRAMLDGQIHDIGRVAETIKSVRKELEGQLGKKLNDVCIAAAGRVLKTVTIHADYEFNEDTSVTDEHIHSLELMGIEKAYDEMKSINETSEIKFFCVGYTVMHYYLNDNMITNLESHKALKISVDLIATFLPEDVIDGLYTAVEKAGLNVENLTLEPIAAINVAIPEKFRLLNIALVDVGAGTSDICVTNDGSIIGYGMIPKAGDAITEKIMKNYLVEFDEAEKIKMMSAANEEYIQYKDIIGISGMTTPDKVNAVIEDIVQNITKDISDKIMELNGGKSVSAVFVVGGGGKHPLFAKCLAEHLKIVPERVALRGEEVLGNILFLQKNIKKDPTLVTPIGICLNYYEQKNNFIFVIVNSESIKLYDNSKLTVMDAVLGYGFPNDKIFPRRGKSIYFTVNGQKRLIRGEAGDPAYITLNGKQADLNAPIMKNDIIEIKESTIGADAEYEVGRLQEYSREIVFIVNKKKVVCPKFIMANDELVSEFYSIKDGDELNILNYYTLKQILEFMDIIDYGQVMVNNRPSNLEDKVYENFSIDISLKEEKIDIEQIKEEALEKESTYLYENTYDDENKAIEDNYAAANTSESTNTKNTSASTAKDTSINTSAAINDSTNTVIINVIVNNTAVVLKGKPHYILVDILDVYPFDVSTVQGISVVIKLNGNKTDFTAPLKDGDNIELYWEK